MKKIELSEIQIVPIKPRDGLVAFASCIVNNQLYLSSIAVYTSPSSHDGYRLVYPTKLLPTGKQINCVHPINRETGEVFQRAIVERYQEIINKIKT